VKKPRKRKPRAASALHRAIAERDEALKFQAATQEILASIRTSVTDAQPVFDAIVKNVLGLFGTRYAAVFLVKDGQLYLAGVNIVREMREARKQFRDSFPQPIDYSTFTGKALRSGKVSQLVPVIGNPQATPQAAALARAFGYDCLVVAPLVRDNEVIGAIGTAHPEAKRFEDRELALLKAFADQAVIAIENARLFNETKEALEKQTATADILQVLSGSPSDTQPVFDAIVRHATRLCESTYANVFRYDGGRLHLAASEGVPEDVLESLKRDYPMAPDRSRVVGRVIQDARVVRVGDTHADPDYDKVYAGALGHRRILGVPLLRGGRPLGAIAVAWTQPGPILPRHEDLLKTFADQAVIAIENVRLFNETKEALERQTATAEVLSAISGSPTDVAPVHGAILQNATRLCEASFAAVFLYDGEYLRAAAHLGASPAFANYLDETRLRPSRETATRRAALEKRVVQVEDLLNDPEFAPAQAHRAENARTVLSVPMLREGALVGLITVWRREPRRFNDQQVGLLKTFADQAVIAIENVRLFNETKEALERQTATAEILRVIGGSMTDTQPVFDAIVQKCGNLFAQSQVALWLIGGGHLHVRASTGESMGSQPIDRESALGVCVLDGRNLHLPDLEEAAKEMPRIRTLGIRLGMRSGIYAPLLHRGRAVGGISVLRREAGAFQEKELALLNTFADQAVIAIQNAQLFNETREALEQQTATAEILKVIAGSPADVQPVLEAIVQAATNLVPGCNPGIVMLEGHTLHHRAIAGPDMDASARDRIAKFFPAVFDPTGSPLSRSIAERTVVEIPDNEAQGLPPQYALAARAMDYRSLTFVPLIREGVGIGAIALSHRVPGFRLADKQLALLKTFADQAVIAIENVRLFNETKEALERQTATAEILKVIASSPSDVQPVFDAIVRSAGRLAEGASVNVSRVAGDRLHLAAYTKVNPSADELLRNLYPFRIANSPQIADAIRTGTSAFVADFETDPRVVPRSREVMKARGFRSTLYVPLAAGGTVHGLLHVSRVEPGPFPEQWLRLFQTFADQAVIAIENVRLFNETKEALERQTATAEILKVIAGSPADVQPVFDAILRSAVTLCGAELAAVFPFDGKLVHLGATHNWPPAALEYFSKVYPSPPSPQLLSGRTILAKSIVQIVDSAVDEHYDPASVASGHWRRMLGAPMLREGTPLGALVVAWRDPGETPPRQVELLQTFADQAAIAIENVRLFNETREALDQQKASAEVLGAISGSIADTKPVFEKILSSCERLFEGELVGITQVEGETVQLAAHHGPEGDRLKKVYPLPLTRESGTGWAILNAEIAHFPDIEAKGVPPGVVAGCRTLKVRAIVFAPMLFEGKGIGAIWVARAQVGAFTEKQIAQLRTFADQAVIAIQNARLFREIQEKSAQLEVANKHKSDFLANMSHELRTPLNAIIGFSEVLSERMFGEVNEKQAEYLKDIHESGRHLLSLINDILDLSKIEAGRMELELSSFDLPSAVSNAMTLVRERAQRHGIQLGLEMDPGVGELQADERKVKQILLNLLSNAVKFTPDGGKVDVCARKADGKIEIAVRDTGIGIAPEDHAAVFEEFKQVGRDYTRKAEGTGLGLALTRRLVELHGGEIALESALGKGSTFTVRLPLR
jgi:GAF domain-containing protein